MAINIEITNKPDVQVLSDIYAECFGAHWMWEAQAIEDMFSVAGTAAFIVKDYGGFGLLRAIGDHAEILTLAVRTAYRRQGIGEAIVKAMQSWAMAHEARAVFLEVRQSNKAALQLYQKAGFSSLSERKDYYRNPDGTHEHAIVLHYKP